MRDALRAVLLIPGCRVSVALSKEITSREMHTNMWRLVSAVHEQSVVDELTLDLPERRLVLASCKVEELLDAGAVTDNGDVGESVARLHDS